MSSFAIRLSIPAAVIRIPAAAERTHAVATLILAAEHRTTPAASILHVVVISAASYVIKMDMVEVNSRTYDVGQFRDE